MIKIIILTIIGILLFYLGIHFDKKIKKPSFKEWNIIAFSITLIHIWLDILQLETLYYIFFSFLFSIFFLYSYIDLKAKEIYRYYSLLMIFIGILFFITQSLLMQEFALNLCYLFLCMIVIVFFSLRKIFGLADSLILVAISLFLSPIHKELLPLAYLLIIIGSSSILLLITHIKSYDKKTHQLKNTVPFLPYLFFSSVLTFSYLLWV